MLPSFHYSFFSLGLTWLLILGNGMAINGCLDRLIMVFSLRLMLLTKRSWAKTGSILITNIYSTKKRLLLPSQDFHPGFMAFTLMINYVVQIWGVFAGKELQC
ncbi:hypothetical protein OC25_02240 [Pedobacter kyungheensis]|uniref:Uncharacterized protein n=1 Tax=Pedobacter kyungheensis TaxID=1069985 RepID=A0A0C1DR98_9SPHI|nr:hypothetical protein OC25_02240 [Pedobacter kyungheensis]